MREVFFDGNGQPRWFVWCVLFLFVLVPRHVYRSAQAKEQMRAREAATRHEIGLLQLEQARNLLKESKLLEAALRASSSMQMLTGTDDYKGAEQLREEARKKLLAARKAQAPQLLTAAEKAYQRPGFVGGGLRFLRPVYISACQIPRDSSLYKRSIELQKRSAKKAFRNWVQVMEDLRPRCEAIRDGLRDPNEL